MKVDTRIVVSHDAPHHAGRVGYFQFFGKGPSEGTMVLAEEPSKDTASRSQKLFAIDKRHAVVEVKQ